jgi:hypothetical protein
MMIYNGKPLMICNSCGIDDIHGSAVIRARGTFPSAPGGRGSEEKGVAAVAERERKDREARCGNGNSDQISLKARYRGCHIWQDRKSPKRNKKEPIYLKIL